MLSVHQCFVAIVRIGSQSNNVRRIQQKIKENSSLFKLTIIKKMCSIGVEKPCLFAFLRITPCKLEFQSKIHVLFPTITSVALLNRIFTRTNSPATSVKRIV
mmetsp:Transcript_7568/g.17197  ORF Transcript_7568/g.17197 Transcript_7568/m.17197 type:complete len:102 (-) Transcript_7568:632-937(-)